MLRPASGTVSGYRIAHDGSVSLLNADGLTGVAGTGPVDMAISNNSHFLYVLNSGSHSISAFQVHSDGSLTSMAGASGLLTGMAGIASR